MSKVIWQAVGACVMALTVMAQADSLDVCPSGCTYDTIQGAIDAAVENDTIEIGPGNYFENLAIDGKTLTLVGLAGRDATIVDAQFDGRCLSIENVTGVTTISGLTFQKGYLGTIGIDFDWLGGGVYADNVSTIHLRDAAVLKCIISNQSGDHALYGGGLYVGGESSLLENVLIQGNRCDTCSYSEGGGVFISADHCKLIRCSVEGNQTYRSNSCSGDGFGVHIQGQYCSIENSLIRNNSVAGTASGGCNTLNGLRSNWPFMLENSVVCGNAGNQIGGAFAGSNNLISDECDSESGPRGVCCLDTGGVDVDNQYHYALLGGVFAGPYTMCNELLRVCQCVHYAHVHRLNTAELARLLTCHTPWKPPVWDPGVPALCRSRKIPLWGTPDSNPYRKYFPASIPQCVTIDSFQLRVLSPSDIDEDFAVLQEPGNQELLNKLFGVGLRKWPWPQHVTKDSDLDDLCWHYNSFLQKRSFSWVIRQNGKYVGCAYYYPTLALGSTTTVSHIESFVWFSATYNDQLAMTRFYRQFRKWIEAPPFPDMPILMYTPQHPL